MSKAKMFSEDDLAYDAQLVRGIRLSGENKDYFARGRLNDLYQSLPPGFNPQKILDFGCGMGEATLILRAQFPKAQVVGADQSDVFVEAANKKYSTAQVSFKTWHDFSELESVDLCYSNGVFHHIDPESRSGVLRKLYSLLSPGAFLAIFENNPLNPGARLVMSRVPFDRDAKMLFPWDLKRLIVEAGFSQVVGTRFLFYFPRFLKGFRFLEPALAHLPFGAQYYVLCRK